MTPSDRRTACIRLLAEIDQKIAECENLARQPILAYDEARSVAAHLAIRLKSRERVERLLEGMGGN